MKHFITRAYNEFELDRIKSTITKLSTTDKLKDEIDYYINIHNTDLSCFFPRLYSFAKKNINKLSIEYYNYKNLFQQLDIVNWENVVESINAVLDLMIDFKINTTTTPHKKSMYIDKTFKYYEDLVNYFTFFREIEKGQNVYIDGKKYFTIKFLQNQIQDLVLELLVNNDEFTIIHGDMCFSNILYSDGVIKLIDPRGSFGEVGIYGDPLYDVAKLRHSYHGLYESIIYDEFSLLKTNNKIDLVFGYKDIFENIEILFNNYKRFQDVRIKLIEGLIFIGMCSRHYDNLDRQIAMYAIGVKILNEALH